MVRFAHRAIDSACCVSRSCFYGVFLLWRGGHAWNR